MTHKKTIFLTFLWLGLLFTGGSLTVLLGAHLYLSPSLPSVESLRDVRLQTPLRIYSADGKLIGEIGEKRRTPVSFNDIPQGYIDALLSAEDADFFSHHGVSIKGLMRAASQLLMSGNIQGGGSTITMQVARNFFLNKRQEFKRKFNEILLALRIERELTKEEILELYVNVIFLGNRAYGIQAASQVYYGSLLDKLTLPQLAMLAGIPKAPSTMNPLANPVRAKQRRDWILSRMHLLEKIDDKTYNDAIDQPLNATYHGNSLDLNASYVAEMARQKAVELYGTKAYTDGYRIYTTIDSEHQAFARKALIDGLLDYDRRHGFRKPEQQLPPPEELVASLTGEQVDFQEDIEQVGTEPEESTIEILTKQWHESLQTRLKDIPSYADLRPVAILKVEERSAQIMLADGSLGQLDWENGIADFHPYINVNRYGSKPKQVSDLLSPGDIIRVKQDLKGNWRLYQLPEAQAAMVSLNPQNGAILSLLGGLDFGQSNFNRATQAKRQPGSNFKPLIYTSALENGYTAASIINDAPIVFNDRELESAWRPENSNNNFLGPIRLRMALYRSVNLVSIRILKNLGIDTALKHIDRFGLDKNDMPRDLSLALGSYAMTPLEVVTAYAVFANGGFKVEPYFIERILNFDGKAVYEAIPPTVCHSCDDQTDSPPAEEPEFSFGDNFYDLQEDPFDVTRELKALLGILEPQDYPTAERVIEPQVAYIMDSILKDVVRRGTAVKAKTLKRGDLAGKTGTTNNATDAWFSGYGGGIVATAWVGFDQQTTLGRREYGSKAALPIWMSYMEKALATRPETPNPKPPGLVTVKIDPKTGKRANHGDKDAIPEVFRLGKVPEFDDGTPENSLWNDDNDGREDISTDTIF